MVNSVLYVGIDVDDNSFHLAGYINETGEILEAKCKPTTKALDNKLKDWRAKFPGYQLKICYEATYLGFSLYRDITDLGYDCAVVAPSSIPRVNGNQVKTDRVDASKLAQFNASGILSMVEVPEPDTEKDRDLLRSRQFVLHQLSEIRSHIQSLFRRNGIHYKSETKQLAHWTKHHIKWIEKESQEVSGSFGISLRLLFQQMKWLMYTLEEYDKSVEEMAKTEKYQRQVNALVCYHGIKNIWALTIITEIGNIKRFKHPNQLSSWAGFDIREYSSGGKSHRFGITKHGNRFLRGALVEANQRFPRTVQLGRILKSRRKDMLPEMVHIAERCRKRIIKKGNRMLFAGKHPNKVKVAVAREMVGFIWESLNAVA